MRDAAHALVEPFAVHGGRLAEARAAFPDVDDWSDLSTGIAPWSYPFEGIAGSFQRLPDPAETAALEAAAARLFGTTAERVVAVSGSDLALRLLGTIIPGRVAVAGPGYSGHVVMWGDRAVSRCSQEGVLAMAQTHDAIVLARPNNPDGWMADHHQLFTAAAQMAARGGYVVVDEAFADATPDDSLSGYEWPGLIVLRSFGKFFGLAGLRLGFVIAPPSLCRQLRMLIGDWPVSGPAIAIGRAAYADTVWQAAQRGRLAVASQRLVALLAAHDHGIIGSTAYFALIAAPRRDSLFVHLARAGLLTRPFASAPQWLRFGLPQDEHDWIKLDEALDAWRSQ